MIEDKRISYINLCGSKYPMCLTVLVQDNIAKEYGSVQKMLEKIDQDGMDALPHWVFLIYQLMIGGKARVKALAFLAGEEVETKNLPGPDQLKEIVGWADITESRKDIYKAIGFSVEQTVEAEEDDEKNGGTAQE